MTGGWVRRHLSDKQVELVALTMQSAFAEGDLVGGLRRGVTDARPSTPGRPGRCTPRTED